MSSTIELSNVATLDLDRLPFDLFVYLADWKSEISPETAGNFFQAMKKTKWAQGKLREHLSHCESLYPTYWKGYAKSKKKMDSDFIYYRLEGIKQTVRKSDYQTLCRDLEKLSKRILGKRYAKQTVYKEFQQIIAGKYKPKTEAQPKPTLASVSATPTPAAKAQTKKEAEKEATDKVFDKPAEPKPEPEKKPPLVEPTKAPVLLEPEEFMPQAFWDLGNLARWEKGKLLLRCVQIVDEARDTKTFRFVAEPALLFNYKPGQFMNIELELDGKRVVRSYTISSSPTRPNVIDITVKRVPGGLVSNWLHDNISLGSYISGKGPSGKFSVVEFPAPKILLVSAGSGVTPMMAMARWIFDTESVIDVGFFHWASTKDVIYKDELELYAKQKETFHLAISLTREDAYTDWNGYRDYISADLIKEAFPDAAERMVFVCGPEGFMKKARQIFKDIGLPEELYLEESFGGAKKPKVKPKPTAAPGAKPDVAKTEGIAKKNLFTGADNSAGMVAIRFTESEFEIISGDNDLTVLEAAEECEIEIDNSCRSGTCGSCKVLKLHGEVNMEGAAALTEEELEEGYILTCVAYPEGFVKVET